MTAAIVVKGNTGWIKLITSGSSEYTKANGEIFTDAWEKGAASDSDIATFKANLKTLGYENIRVQKGVSTVVSASYPDTLNSSGSSSADLQAVQDADWGISYNLIECKIETNDDYQRNPEINTLISLIEEKKESNTLAAYDFSATTTTDFNNNALRDAIVRGQDSFYRVYRIIRQTITTNSKTLLKLSHSNILKTFSYADIGVPALFATIHNLSEGHQFIQGTDYTLRWLKMPPQFNTISRRKYQIINEWQEINPDPFTYLQKDSTTWPSYVN